MKRHLRYSIVLMLLLISNSQTFAQSAMPDTVCVGATKTYRVNDPSVPSTYTWKVDGVTQAVIKNEINITWNNPGTFSITVQEHSAVGCDGDIRSGLVYVSNGSHSDTTVTACNSFTWNRTNTTYTNSGNYNYIATNATGCSDTITLKLTINNGSHTTQSASACGSYLWAINNQSYTASGSYDYINTNGNGCTDTVTLDLLITSLPTATISGDGTICAGSVKTLDINLTGTSPWTVTYSDGALQTINSITSSPYQLTVSPAKTTTYYLINVADANCANIAADSATIIVSQPIPAVRYPAISATVNLDKQLQARVFNAADLYRWNPSTGLNNYLISNPVFNYNKTTEYNITISTATGCIVVDTVLVIVLPDIAPTNQVSDVFVPKAFSPNNDGHNDKLIPRLFKIKDFKYFRVFNRWGQLIFETNIQGDGWDGTFKGKALAADVFTWTTEATGTDGRTTSKRGTTILLR